MLLRRILRRIPPFRKPRIPAYIHIPKTGGTYLAQREGSARPVIQPLKYLGHRAVIHQDGIPNYIYYPHDPVGSEWTISKSALWRYFVFCCVRNPFDWLVSYAGHAAGWNPAYRNADHYDYQVASKGFDYLVRTIADREQPWPSRKFIFFQMFASDADLIVDWIARTETLDQDLSAIARRLGVRYARKPRQRVGVRRDYRSYYDDGLIDLVSSIWSREMELFGYHFEGWNDQDAILIGKVPRARKKTVHYDIRRDEMTISGRIFSPRSVTESLVQ